MRSSASSIAAISRTPLAATGSAWCPPPISSALCTSDSIARSMRAISFHAIQPASSVSTSPAATTSGIRPEYDVREQVVAGAQHDRQRGRGIGCLEFRRLGERRAHLPLFLALGEDDHDRHRRGQQHADQDDREYVTVPETNAAHVRSGLPLDRARLVLVVPSLGRIIDPARRRGDSLDDAKRLRNWKIFRQQGVRHRPGAAPDSGMLPAREPCA